MKKIILFLTFILGLSLANSSFAYTDSSYTNYWKYTNFSLLANGDVIDNNNNVLFTDIVQVVPIYQDYIFLKSDWTPIGFNPLNETFASKKYKKLYGWRGMYCGLLMDNSSYECYTNFYSSLNFSIPNDNFKFFSVSSFPSTLHYITSSGVLVGYSAYNDSINSPNYHNLNDYLGSTYPNTSNNNDFVSIFYPSYWTTCWVRSDSSLYCFGFDSTDTYSFYFQKWIDKVYYDNSVFKLSDGWYYYCTDLICKINAFNWLDIIKLWYDWNFMMFYWELSNWQKFNYYVWTQTFSYYTDNNNYKINVLDSKPLSYQKCENKYFSYEYAWSFFDSNTFSYSSSWSYYQSFNNWYVYKFNDETFLSTYAIWLWWNAYQSDNYLDISWLFSKNLIVKTLWSRSNAIDWQYNQWFKLQSVNWDIEFVSLYWTWDVSYYYLADNNWNRLFPSENWWKGRQFLMNQVNKIKWYWLWDTLYVLLETWRLSKTYTINSISFWDYKTQYSEWQWDKYCVTYTPEDTSHITYDSSSQKYIYDDWDIKWEVKFNPDTNKFDVVDDNWDIKKSIPSIKKHTIDWVDFTQEQVDKASWQDNINRTNEIKQEETKVAWCSDDWTSLSITWSNFFSQDFWKIVRSFLYCKMDVESWITYLKINVPPHPDLDFNFVWPKVTFIWWNYFLSLEKVSWKFTVITDKSWVLSIDTSPTSWSYLLTFFIFIIYVIFRFTIIFLIFIVYPLFDYISKKISIILFTWESAVFDSWNLASMFVYIPVYLFRYGVLLSIFAIVVAHLLDVGNYSIDFFNAFLWMFLSSLWTYSFFSNLFNLFISWIIWYSTLYLIYLLVKKFGRVN